ncbi:MAG TPA: methyl-accepting chemotaxis protein [bacterium]|nr:methyl-accepting chemotaxis protein [bacterium]
MNHNSEADGRRMLSRHEFVIRLLGLMLLLAFFQFIASHYLIYNVFHPDAAELEILLDRPGPGVIIIFIFILALMFNYLRPILSFLGDAGREVEIPDERARLVAQKCMNFPYLMVGFAFVSNILGGLFSGLTLMRWLDWGARLVYCLVFGGVMIALMAAPLAIYCYHWLVRPVIEMAAHCAPGLPPSFSAGLRVSVRTKMVLIITSLVVAVAGYVGFVGYSHSSTLLSSLERVEAALPEEVKAELGRQKGVILSSEWKARIGDLGAMYVIFVLVASAVSLLVALLSSREISEPIAVLDRAAQRIRQGGYGEPVRLIKNDELADLGAAFNRMMDTIVAHVGVMEGIVGKLERGIRSMDDSIRVVLGVCTAQALGSARQASAVSQSSAIAHQIVSTSRLIDEGARNVGEVSGEALSACQGGESTVARARDDFAGIARQVSEISAAMRHLEDDFSRILRIVDLLEDIADQTDILSVNAALEAAGAGEHGRRFGVVATATRMLAQKSADAAGEVKQLVGQIQQATQESAALAKDGENKVEAGNAAMGAVVSAFADISSLAETTALSAREITVATKEQESASEQLAASMLEVQSVAAEVEKGAREIESAVADLRRFAESLKSEVEDRTQQPEPYIS